MHFKNIPTTLLFGLFLIAIVSQSCVSNLASHFGKQDFQVNANVADFAVTPNALNPISVTGKTGAFQLPTSKTSQIVCFKNGYQDELITLVPNQKNKFRYIDLGAGVVLAGTGLAILNTGGGAVSTILGGGATVYGASHLLNAAIPAGTFGAYGKYDFNQIPFKLYPDSAPNAKHFVIGCNSFMLNTPKRKVVGSISSFGKYLGVIRFTDSLLIDSLRMVDNVNQHLVKLKLANKWTKIKKVNSSDATFSEEPNLFLTAQVKELTQNGLQAFDKDELVFKAGLTVEWTLTDKAGKILMKKITKGEGTRKQELFSNFNRSQELTAMDDAIRRALNELIFSPQFIEILGQ